MRFPSASDSRPIESLPPVILRYSEEMGGQKTWTVLLDVVEVNTGLQDSNFDIR
jgi:hypothetical protein